MKIILLGLKKNIGRSSRKKKAVSTIIGGVIIFAIVFSTIADLFHFHRAGHKPERTAESTGS